MSTKADILLSIHLLAAVTWVGGNLALQILLTRAYGDRDADRMGYLGREAGWVGMRVFSLASLLILVSGVLLVDELGYEYGQFWITFAFVVLFASFVTGVAFLGPQGEKLGALLQAEGLSDPALAQFKKVLAVSRVELLFLLLVVVDMAVKPGL